jgi:peroxin-2
MQEDWSHEIVLALRAVLFKLSVWDHNASYGASLQNLKYTDSRSRGPVYSNPTTWQKTLYGIFTVGGRYAWDKWEGWLVGQEAGYEEVTISMSCDEIQTNSDLSSHRNAFASCRG